VIHSRIQLAVQSSLKDDEKIGDAQLSEAEPQPDCQIKSLLSTSEAINPISVKDWIYCLMYAFIKKYN